jgi:hypothetical protein
MAVDFPEEHGLGVRTRGIASHTVERQAGARRHTRSLRKHPYKHSQTGEFLRTWYCCGGEHIQALTLLD